MQQDNGQSRSVWMETAEVPPRLPLSRDATADVCVIGAGIAGLSVAYMLAREGKSVVVLDDGPTGGGETARTTAHLAFYLDDDLTRVERLFGTDGLKKAIASHRAAVDRIESIVRE